MSAQAPSGLRAFGPARAGRDLGRKPEVRVGGDTWIKLVEEGTSVALFGHAGGLRLTHAGQEAASAALKGNERDGTAIWEGSSSWNKTNSASNKSPQKIAPTTGHVFRKCATRFSPIPTKKSGAAMASHRCLITK